jgi:glutamate synthase domain-containing protein 1
MHAREGVLESDLFKEDLAKTLPVIETEVSDSGSFDNVLEFLMMNVCIKIKHLRAHEHAFINNDSSG